MANALEPAPQPRSAIVRFAQARPVTCFFVLAYLWSWTCWLVVPRFFQEKRLSSISDTAALVLILVGAWGPTVGALITRWLGHRDLRICRVWSGWSVLIWGLCAGLLGFFVVTLLAPSMAMVKTPVGGLHWWTLLHWSTYAVNYSTFLGGPLPEEPGWRGFALPRLQARYGPIWATLILALFWAGWHLPLFSVEGWTTARPWQFLLILVGVSSLLTAAANLTQFGVMVAIVLHAFFNTSIRLVNSLTSNLPHRGDDTLMYTIAVFICGTVLGIALLVWLQFKSPRTNASGATCLSLRES